MKKITILSILLIFFSNLLFADSHDIDPTRFHLEKKNSDQFGLYNIYVENWNNHVTDLYSDSSCQGLPVTLNWLTDYTNCSYRNTKTLTQRNKMNIEEIIEAEHEVYVDLFERAKVIERKWTYDTSNIENEATEFFKYWGQVYIKKNNYLRDLWKQKAIEAQSDFNRSNVKKQSNDIKKNVSSNKELNYKDYWWVLIILALGAFYLFSVTTPKPELKQKRKIKKSDNISKNFKLFWDGKISYGYSYWVYLTIIGTIISLPALIISESDKFWEQASTFVILATIIYGLLIIISQIYLIVGTWRSADFYKEKKRKLKQSPIWGYLGQASIIISLIKKFSQFLK